MLTAGFVFYDVQCYLIVINKQLKPVFRQLLVVILLFNNRVADVSVSETRPCNDHLCHLLVILLLEVISLSRNQSFVCCGASWGEWILTCYVVDVAIVAGDQAVEQLSDYDSADDDDTAGNLWRVNDDNCVNGHLTLIGMNLIVCTKKAWHLITIVQ